MPDEKKETPVTEEKEQTPATAQDHHDQGNKLVQAGKHAEAIPCYDAAIEKEPTTARYGNRSLCHSEVKNFDQALEDADSSIALDSKYEKAYCRKIAALIGLKRHDDALALCSLRSKKASGDTKQSYTTYAAEAMSSFCPFADDFQEERAAGLPSSTSQQQFTPMNSKLLPFHRCDFVSTMRTFLQRGYWGKGLQKSAALVAAFGQAHLQELQKLKVDSQEIAIEQEFFNDSQILEHFWLISQSQQKKQTNVSRNMALYAFHMRLFIIDVSNSLVDKAIDFAFHRGLFTGASTVSAEDWPKEKKEKDQIVPLLTFLFTAPARSNIYIYCIKDEKCVVARRKLNPDLNAKFAVMSKVAHSYQNLVSRSACVWCGCTPLSVGASQYGSDLAECPGCHSVAYCSETCRRHDWAAHRHECGRETSGICPTGQQACAQHSINKTRSLTEEAKHATGAQNLRIPGDNDSLGRLYTTCDDQMRQLNMVPNSIILFPKSVM